MFKNVYEIILKIEYAVVIKGLHWQEYLYFYSKGFVI